MNLIISGIGMGLCHCMQIHNKIKFLLDDSLRKFRGEENLWAYWRKMHLLWIYWGDRAIEGSNECMERGLSAPLELDCIKGPLWVFIYLPYGQFRGKYPRWSSLVYVVCRWCTSQTRKIVNDKLELRKMLLSPMTWKLVG